MQPSNQTFHNDLSDFCKQVLGWANAKKSHANLMAISNTAAEQVENYQENTRTFRWDPNIVQAKSVPKRQQIIATTNIEVALSNTACLHIAIMRWNHGITSTQVCISWNGVTGKRWNHSLFWFRAHCYLAKFQQTEKEATSEMQNKVLFVLCVIPCHCNQFLEAIIPRVCIPSLNDNSRPKGNGFYNRLTTKGIVFDGIHRLVHGTYFSVPVPAQEAEGTSWTILAHHCYWLREHYEPVTSVHTYAAFCLLSNHSEINQQQINVMFNPMQCAKNTWIFKSPYIINQSIIFILSQNQNNNTRGQLLCI